MSTAKLSKLENARTLPTTADVERILMALKAPVSVREELMALTRSAVTEQRAWRVYKQSGFHKKQMEISAIEEQTSQIFLFQPTMVPGLLQSAEYTQSVFENRIDLSSDERGRTIEERMRRQNILYRPGRNFHFIVCESALRWMAIPPAEMAAQVDKMVSLSLLRNVTVDVVPLDGVKRDFPMTAFCVFDNRLVTVETFHAEISTRDPKDIDVYLNVFKDMRSMSLRDGEARNFLSSLASEMRRSAE